MNPIILKLTQEALLTVATLAMQGPTPGPEVDDHVHPATHLQLPPLQS